MNNPKFNVPYVYLRKAKTDLEDARRYWPQETVDGLSSSMLGLILADVQVLLDHLFERGNKEPEA